MFIPLTKPDIGDAEMAAMLETIQRGKITQGEVTARFEKACAEAIGVDGGVGTNSGTSAIVLALAALNVVHGDEVIIPSYTCLAVLNAVMQAGAVPVLVDCQNDPVEMNFNIQLCHVRQAISHRTRAIVVPHMFGVPADVTRIRELGIPVIEDITLSFGATTPEGRVVGSIGDLAICSFHASKMVACGEGGIVLGKEELVTSARQLNGEDSEQVEQRFGAPLKPYRMRYGFRLSDTHAACGLVQLGRLQKTIERRRELARQYAEMLHGLSNVLLPHAGRSGDVFFRFIVQVTQRKVIEVLRAFADARIEAGRGVFPPLHRILFKNETHFPGAEAASVANLSIPLYPALSDAEVDYVLQASRDVLAVS